MTNVEMTILDVLRAAAEKPCAVGGSWPYLGKLAPDAANHVDAGKVPDPDPSSTVVTVYAAACDGLRRLAAPGAWSICKLGVTAGLLRQRLHWMGQDCYGSAYRTEQGRLVVEQAFTDWLAHPMPVTEPVHPDSCVTPVGRGLRVQLPASLSVRVFDRALSAALEPIAVDRLMATPAGVARCNAFGLEGARYQRLTCYDFAGQARISRAREVVFFRPRLDTDALVRVIEAVVAEHLAGVAGEAKRAA